MRMAMIAIGTRGDVQPYVALGRGLQAAGHHVCLISTDNYQEFVRGHGLEFASTGADTQAIYTQQGGQPWSRAGDRWLPVVSEMQVLMQAAVPYAEQAMRRAYRACLGAEALVFSLGGAALGYHIAEKTGLPAYPALLHNLQPTPAFPSAFAPQWPLGSAYNSVSYRAVNQFMWQFLRTLTNTLRRQVLDLPPLGWSHPLEALWRQRHPHLLGYSPAVLPPPADWGDWAQVTGFWLLDSPAGYQPPAAVARFLEAGPPPVVIGLGSTPIPDAPARTEQCLEALQRAGQRGLFITGWSGLGAGPLPDWACAVDAIPHDWLYPRAAAVVHHGGAGTTAAALRAGRPAVIVPSMWDQPFWARRVARLGAGLALPLAHLNAENLAAAIRRVAGDPRLRRRADELGRQVRAEDGVARAVAAFERFPPRAIPPARRPARLARHFRVSFRH